MAIYSYGPYGYGSYSYGPYCHGPYSHGPYSYGPYSYGLYSYGLCMVGVCRSRLHSQPSFTAARPERGTITPFKRHAWAGPLLLLTVSTIWCLLESVQALLVPPSACFEGFPLSACSEGVPPSACSEGVPPSACSEGTVGMLGWGRRHAPRGFAKRARFSSPIHLCARRPRTSRSSASDSWSDLP